MKQVIQALLLLFSLTCHSQDINNLKAVYQSILDDRDFISALNDPVFYCDSSLKINANGIDSTIDLTFKGIKLERLRQTKENELYTKCPIITFDFNNSAYSTKKKKSLVIIVIKHYAIDGDFGKSEFVKYSCYLKKKKNTFVIIKSRITRGQSNADYL